LKSIFLTVIFFCVIVYGADTPRIIYKEGKSLASFDIQQGKQPCKKKSPCLFFHKDSDNLRLIIEDKNIRMAYKSKDMEKIPFPKNFRLMSFQEKIEIVKDYRDFFKSEFAVMLQAFVYTVPEIFDWDVEKFKMAQDSFLISEKELGEIFSSGKEPKLYIIAKFKCLTGENVVFESDAGGIFFMEIER
jgi:hypothetical protein